MSAEDFFSRWAKKNHEAQEARAAEPAVPQPAPEPDPFEDRIPTQDDLDQLSPQGDFSAFMKQGVDENLKRSALKKLFSDPHFNIMDGLDIYIDDYNKPDPIPPEMMAMLQHAKGLLDPEGLKDQPVMALRSERDVTPGEQTAGGASSPSAADAEESPADMQGAATPHAPQQPDLQQTEASPTEQQSPATQEPATQEPATPPTHDTSGTHPERETPKP
jgi:hypothetical protein